MRFYSDMDANYGVWDGKKMLEFTDGVYETDVPAEIKLLKGAGLRHDPEKPTEE